jgi:hypothetical protein
MGVVSEAQALESSMILGRGPESRQFLDHDDAARRVGAARHQINVNIPILAGLAKLLLGILPLWEQPDRTIPGQQGKSQI